MRLSENIEKVANKLFAKERLNHDDCLTLYRHPDLNELAFLAHQVKTDLHGNRATYVFNRYLNYSNVCILSCQFCAFAKKKRDPEAFEYAIEEMAHATRESAQAGITEIHMVGGLHPTLPFDYYLELLRALKQAAPSIHLKCFTAIEIRHLADRIAKMPIADTLEKLRGAGLDSLTGGGAEIFNPEVRDRICRGKESAQEWKEVHRIWHGMGGKSTCTMLYGHVETIEDRVDHMLQLRELQEETGGFSAFIPFAFEPENNLLSHIRRASAMEELRNLAVARLVLDNIPHLTAYWVSMGLPLAQVALSYGVDDLHGTIFDEKIFHMAGSKTPLGQTVQALRHAIEEAGMEPHQRNSYYELIDRAKPEAA